MANIDRGSRLTYAALKAHFDGVALVAQQVGTKIGDDFSSFTTSGYADNTLLRDLDIAIDGTTTGLMTPIASVNAMGRLAPPLDSMRKLVTSQTLAGTTAAMVALGYGQYVKSLMHTFATGYDGTHDSFWEALAALWTSGQYVPGEVVDIMNAIGIKTDPDYCYPPAHKYLANIAFTGAATATLTTKDEIDPLLYTVHATGNIEWYCIKRNGTPDAIDATLADGRDEDDTPTDTGATDFTFDVTDAEGKGSTDVLGQTSSKLLCSTRNATFSCTGGQDAEEFALRVKTLREMAFPT